MWFVCLLGTWCLLYLVCVFDYGLLLCLLFTLIDLVFGLLFRLLDVDLIGIWVLVGFSVALFVVFVYLLC